ncbi:MAG: S-methyl-5'-thioadenosine phosphorylase [Chloroflexi bacterium]|nr:S-methyl-5'-thioadenosine phosphorylase [Chloroflexota bacterium]MCH8283433.1 S-methyl-5'-thioadenosine phosphorylase [Chloroflexota bacterium]MCI0769992.1 S-methyl-5'-thioadenosine phosphorylase [Chloroflexota bacterium]
MAQTHAEIGVIGGSGLYEMAGLTDVEEVRIATPFGDPSDAIVLGALSGRRVAFLPRHGRGHRINPTNVPFRANIFALKILGVKRILSVSAVGSLTERIHPLDMVVPDQLIDRTKSRPSTFFNDGVVVHVGFANPFCNELSDLVFEEASSQSVSVHRGGTYLAIEGPQFSTVAESELYRSWGASIIGMTAVPEAKLAREAEMCYATLACSTDYDCWHPEHDAVTADMIMGNLAENAEHAKSIVSAVVSRIPETAGCRCQSALEGAIVTAPELIPPRVRDELAPLIGKYVGAKPKEALRP